MDALVDQILADYGRTRSFDIDKAREKITLYFLTLAAARKLNEHQLTSFGLAYPREFHEGRDPEYSGM